MSHRRTGPASLLCALLAALAVASTAGADPDEAILARAPMPPGLRPLLVLLLDDSVATTSEIDAREPYDPARDYTGAGGACHRDRAYWRRGPGPPPDCDTQPGLAQYPPNSRSGLHCDAARAALARHGFFVAARAAQWQAGSNGGYWAQPLAASEAIVECRSDRGRHGATAGRWYATDGAAGPWSDSAAAEIRWDAPPLADSYTFYTGNYLAWLRQAATRKRPARLVAADALAAALAATDELDLAVLRLAEPSRAYIARAASPASTSTLPLAPPDPPATTAPLATMLLETIAWLRGTEVDAGDHPDADPAARDPADPDRYRSPLTHACQPLRLLFVTAGIARGDENAAAAARRLPDFDAVGGDCDGSCLPALARWLSSADLRADLPAAQRAQIDWLLPSLPVPEQIAAAISSGAGTLLTLHDPTSLPTAIARALQQDAAVVGPPALSAAGLVAASDHESHDAVLHALSWPVPRARWRGNLFRYALAGQAGMTAGPGAVDRDGQAAIDLATGLPAAGTRSAWSDAPDAPDFLRGGAAGRLPAATQRRIFSELAGGDLTDPANRLAPGNPRIGRRDLGLVDGDPDTPGALLDWFAGDRSLGDPGRGAPRLLHDPQHRFAFVATQDGLLQAFDAETGTERWAWLPRRLLPRLPGLRRNEATTARDHGLDGRMLLHRHDPDGDGRIDPARGEHAWLFVGLGRGGAGYYALDLSAAESPRLLWSQQPPVLDAETQSTAAPVLARLPVDHPAQTSGSWVLLLAGGHDPALDSGTGGTTGRGNFLLLVDAASGAVLWRGGGSPDADLVVAGMDAPVVAAPRALDVDGDGLLDRAYVVDAAGRLWRFDFVAGRRSSSLASVRLLARLGDNIRQFQSSPDVAPVRRDGRLRFALSLGSGRLSRPRDMGQVDRFYSLLDPDAPAAAVIEEADLHEVLESGDPMPAAAQGWLLRLDRHGPGEKLAGPALTFGHVLHFATHQPLPPSPDSPCGPPRAVNRLYQLDIRSGMADPRVNWPGTPGVTELTGAGLPPELRIAFPPRTGDACAGCRPSPAALSGGLGFETSYGNDPVKTSWRRLDPPRSR